jgi:hypothetical protein
MNDLLEYNTNTNETTRGKGTKLIHLSSLKQFDQVVSEKPIRPCLGWFKKICETNKGMLSKTQTAPK